MNKWKTYVANFELEIESENNSEALKILGVFTNIERVDHFVTCDQDDVWIYRVESDEKTEIVVVKRTKGGDNKKCLK